MDSKRIMAENIKRLMAQKDVNAMDVCRALNIKQPTFSDWTNAKYYPRVDKINKMAEYFGVDTYELTEPHSKIELLNKFRDKVDELERLDAEYQVLSKENHDFIIEFNKMDRKKRDHLLAYMRLLNNES